MRDNCRYLLIFVAMLASTAKVALAADTDPGSDSVKSSLQRHAFPWYDAKADAYRPLVPDQQKEPTTSNTSSNQPSTDSPKGMTISQLLLWLIVLLFIGTTLFFIFRHFDGFESAIENPSPTVQTKISIEAMEALPEPTRGVDDLLGEAGRLAALSNFEMAIAFYFSWQLVQLDRRRFIELGKGKTNRQYSRELARTQPELSAMFSNSTKLFEDAFFGKLPVTRGAFDLVWDSRKDFQGPAEGKRR